MRETTPTVRLIAEPRIRWDAVESYLAEVNGLAWLNRVCPDDLDRTGPAPKPIASDAELLIEYAGRRCYRSWDVGLNPNVTQVRTDSRAYLENVLSVKHGSVLEHAQFTFDFADVSRVFTHELVRHRAGVAISQESLRYVRLTDLGFRVPEILKQPVYTDTFKASTRTLETRIVSLVETLEEFQRDAAEAFGLDDDGVPFHYKKEVTSALRRLAPIGLSTGMVWSANIRTLRHIIDQRTAPGAEEEIRFVFDQVARIMNAECPALFGDFEPQHQPPCYQDRPPCACVPHWKPQWEKV